MTCRSASQAATYLLLVNSYCLIARALVQCYANLTELILRNNFISSCKLSGEKLNRKKKKIIKLSLLKSYHL